MRHALPDPSSEGYGPPDPGTHGSLLRVPRPYQLRTLAGLGPVPAARPRRNGRGAWRARVAVGAGLVAVFLATAAGIAASGDSVHLPDAAPPPAPAPEWTDSAVPATDPYHPSDMATPGSPQTPGSAQVTPGALTAAPNPSHPGSSPQAVQPPPAAHATAPVVNPPPAVVNPPPPVTQPTTPRTTAPAGRALVSAQSGKCLRANATDGSPVQLYSCDGSSQQRWTVMSDGTIRTGGMCLDAAWGSTANATIVQVVRCSGNPAQQFRLNGAADLVNVQADRCVDVKDHNTANGTTIQLWDCSGNSNQKWTLR